MQKRIGKFSKLSLYIVLLTRYSPAYYGTF